MDTYDFVVMLSGTPVENNISEYLNIISLINYNLYLSLHRMYKMTKHSPNIIEKLVNILKIFTLRRLKTNEEVNSKMIRATHLHKLTSYCGL